MLRELVFQCSLAVLIQTCLNIYIFWQHIANRHSLITARMEWEPIGPVHELSRSLTYYYHHYLASTLLYGSIKKRDAFEMALCLIRDGSVVYYKKA